MNNLPDNEQKTSGCGSLAPLAGSALFIPLKRRFFEEFADGSKTCEYRLYGPRWNEKTCVVGRAVTLSMGYGKQRRLSGKIVQALRLPHVERIPGWSACYGENPGPAMGIKIEVLPNNQSEPHGKTNMNNLPDNEQKTSGCGSLAPLPGWAPASLAPKDAVILADFGWPWPVMAQWCAVSEKWAAVSVQRDHATNDAWFETEYELPADLRYWMPLPALPNPAD